MINPHFTLQAWTNEEVEYEMDLIESTVKCLRSLRAEVFEDRKNERYTLDFCFVLVARLVVCIRAIQVFGLCVLS
jgi:valyl-tRNA synthetase